MSKETKPQKISRPDDSKEVKPFYVYLEGDKFEVTKQMIKESSPEVIKEYQRILCRYKQREQRRARCINPDGTRCREKCALCERAQRIDINAPCNGLPIHLESMEENGAPMPASNTFISPEESVIRAEEHEELLAAIDTLSEKGQTVLRLHIEGLTSREIAEQTGIPQSTVSYQTRSSVKKLKKIMKR